MFFFVFFVFAGSSLLYAQDETRKLDSLLATLPSIKNDTIKTQRLNEIAFTYYASGSREAITYAREALALADRISFKKGMISARNIIGLTYLETYNYPESLSNLIIALELSRETGYKEAVANIGESIGNVYADIGDTAKASSYYMTALTSAEEIDDLYLMAAITMDIGTLASNQGNFSRASDYYNKALQHYIKLGDKNSMNVIYGNIGRLYSLQGNFPRALEHYFKALEISKESESLGRIALNSVRIGEVYSEFKANYQKALEYYNYALKIYEQTGDSSGLGITYSAMGKVFSNMQQYSQALNYHLKSLEIAKAIGKNDMIAKANDHVGINYKELKQYGKALSYYREGLKINQELGSSVAIAISNGNIGEIYMKMALDSVESPQEKKELLTQAIGILESSKNELTKFGALDYSLFYSNTLSDAYFANGDYKNALAIFKEHILIKDSLFNKENNQEFTRRELNYEYEKRQDSLKLENEKRELTLQKEIQLQQLRYEYEKRQALAKTDEERQRLSFEEELKRQKIENDFEIKQAGIVSQQEKRASVAKASQDRKDLIMKDELIRQKLQRNFSIAIIILLIISMIIVIRDIQRKKLQEKQSAQLKTMIETQESERKRISRDLHDDIGTKLSALGLFLSSMKEKASGNENREIRELARSSELFIKEAVNDLRELLLDLSPSVLEDFGYTTAVEGLINKINETKLIHFNLVIFGIKERFRKDYELALYRITQELVNNVLKHADAKNVTLQIGRRDDLLILMIEDNGKGFEKATQIEGYGLKNLSSRAALLAGKMTIDTAPGKGTSVLIEIPYHSN